MLRNALHLALLPLLCTGLAATTAAQTQKGSTLPARPSFGNGAPTVILPEMTKATAIAGLGTVVTAGNGHTGGCAWVDYNGDYLPDLFITNAKDYEHYLFRNEGDGTFTDVSALVAKPDITKESAAVACADLDNDGDTDIVVAVDFGFMNINIFNNILGGPNLVYENQGDGTFLERGAAWGLVDPDGFRNITVNLADIDLDGKVDAYFGFWAPNHSAAHARFNKTYLNGGSTFSVFTSGAEDGLETLAALFYDANMDLYPDLYVGNIAAINLPPVLDCTDNFFEGGPGGLFTLTSYAGIGDDACAPMGLDVGDIDNDGDWDLYCTDLYLGPNIVPGNHLYEGNPDGSLSDNSAAARGVLSNDSWPANFMDIDRDGWVDLWVGCAREGQPDFIYMNKGNGDFEDRTPSTWQAGLESKGGSIADYDADGDMDVFIVNDNLGGSGLPDGLSNLWRNDTQTPYGWMQFKLIGVTSNRDAIGATVFVTGGGITQMRRVSGGDSAHSQQEQVLHFGTAFLETVDVEVRWPSGIVQMFTDVPTNEFHVIDESAGLSDEDFSLVSARLERDRRTLTVEARSTYGGRTKLEVPALGALEYDAATTRFVGSFQVDPERIPEQIQVESQRGASRQVAVQRL